MAKGLKQQSGRPNRPNWSWADYERCKRAEERRAAIARPCAAPAHFPYRDHGTLAQNSPPEALAPEGAKASAAQPPQGQPAARSDAAEGRVSEDIAPAEAGAQTDTRIAARGSPTADSVSGCEGQAPEGTRGSVLQGVSMPANACQSRAPKIDLRGAPSSLELRAASWKGRR